AAAELVGDAPDGALTVAGLVVVDGEAGPGQDVDVAPDGADVAVQGARGVLDRHAGRPVDQLQQAPLPVELVAARHSMVIVRSRLSGVNSWIRPVRPLYSGREGHEVDNPLLGDERSAVDKAAVEPGLPA